MSEKLGKQNNNVYYNIITSYQYDMKLVSVFKLFVNNLDSDQLKIAIH